MVKNPPASAGDLGSIPMSGRSLRRKWQLTQVFLPGKSHAQRSLVGYSPWGYKESDTTEQLPACTHTCSGMTGVLIKGNLDTESDVRRREMM